MPVRIVRDTPDEEVLNDSFDFDTPNNHYEDNNSINENQENNSYQEENHQLHTNNHNDNFDLGSLSNLLFGGGSQDNTQSVFGSLASMAIGACVGYAIDYFRNSHSQQRAAGAYSHQEAEELYQARMAASQVCVSIWSYAVGADRIFNEAEAQQVNELLGATIQSLFPASVANQELVKQELEGVFHKPLPYEDAVRRASKDRNFAMQVYHQAALIIAADSSYEGREQNFMTNLAKDLRLTATDIRPIHQKIGL